MIIEPPPVSNIFGIAYLLVNIILLRLVSRTLSQFSSSTLVTSPTPNIPTLLTRISRRPKEEIAKSTIFSASEILVTSELHITDSPPRSRMAEAVFCAYVSFLSTNNTLHPCLAKVIEIALPTPSPLSLEPAPVTIATLFDNR